MKIYGLDAVEKLLESDGYLFKLVANDQGAILFPHTSEHRDVQQPGIRYADDSAGNALAAMVMPGRIEFRFHNSFSDERVRQIIKDLLNRPDLAFAASFTVIYQGRVLIAGENA